MANGSLDLEARAIVLRSFTVQGGCIGPETRALLAAVLCFHGSQRIMSRDSAEHVGALLALKLSRCMIVRVDII